MGLSWFVNSVRHTSPRSASVLTIMIPHSRSEWPPKYLVPVIDQDFKLSRLASMMTAIPL